MSTYKLMPHPTEPGVFVAHDEENTLVATGHLVLTRFPYAIGERPAVDFVPHDVDTDEGNE